MTDNEKVASEAAEHVEVLQEEGGNGHTRKRTREGSIEPTVAAELSPAPSGSRLATKKGRIDEETGEPTAENVKVGEVREQVEKLSHDEEKALHPRTSNEAMETASQAGEDVELSASTSDGGLKRKMLQRTSSTQLAESVEDQSKRIKGDESPAAADAPAMPAATKKQPSFSSFSSSASPFATVKSGNETLSSTSNHSGLPKDVAEKVKQANAPATSATLPAATESAPPPPPKKTQASFGSFSSTTSPFAKSSGYNAFASSSTSSGSRASSVTPATTTKTAAFGGWSGSSANAFATPSKPAEGESKPEVEDKAAFREALSQQKESVQVEKAKLDLEEQQAFTGEEDEQIVHQVRVKLYVMEGDAWKERGTGSLHLNIPADGSPGARLGVFRLCLNVSLYAGMPLELADKSVRAVVLEEGSRRSIAIKTGSAKTAAELYAKVKDYLPSEAKRSETPGSADKSKEDV